jgi:hypothetical protein
MKTKTDLLFEDYLGQRGIRYKYEPFGDQDKNPDYLLTIRGKTILVEIKELQETPLDRVTKASLAKGGGTFSIDPGELSKMLRRRIDAACRQLKPHKDKVDYCLVLIGVKQGYYELGVDEIFYAMYGDLYLSIPFDIKKGGSMSKAESRLKATGSLRKNHPLTKLMYSPHEYLSGVGIVKSFNGHRYYENKFYEQSLRGINTRDWGAHRMLKFLKGKWLKHKNKIPKIYKDTKRVLYKVELVSNPLSNKPLPAGLFNARWDYVRFPTIVYEN